MKTTHTSDNTATNCPSRQSVRCGSFPSTSSCARGANVPNKSSKSPTSTNNQADKAGKIYLEKRNLKCQRQGKVCANGFFHRRPILAFHQRGRRPREARPPGTKQMTFSGYCLTSTNRITRVVAQALGNSASEIVVQRQHAKHAAKERRLTPIPLRPWQPLGRAAAEDASSERLVLSRRSPLSLSLL